MLNSMSAIAIYGIPDPLQGFLNLSRTNAQILTQDFEQVHDRSVPGIAEQGGTVAVDAAEAGQIREALRHRPERPLATITLERVSPMQATVRFRQVQGWLVAAAEARQSNGQPALSLFV